MDKDFADIIQRMAREQGKEVLFNGKAKMYLGDYCEGRFKKEASVFRQIMDAGCGEHINNADNVPERKQKLMKQLEDDNGLSPKVTGEYLDLLGLILKGDTSKCGILVQAAPAAQSAPTIGKLQLDDGIYVGEIVNGKPYGKGKKAYTDGDVYEGDFVDGLPRGHGKGKRSFNNGDVYEGDFMDDMWHGKGKYTWANGTVYEGDFVKTKQHGKGKKTLPDGTIFEGDFVNDQQCGKGKMIFADGDVLEGEWVDGKMHGHGKGKMTSPDGDVYEGDFVDDVPYGKGKMTTSDGDLYEGDWVDGKAHGKGKYTWADGDVYEGDFVDDSAHGKGKRTFANGDVYEGDIVNGVAHGKGKMAYADGNVYEGNWFEGKRNGKGKMTNSDGRVYEGDWVDDSAHGKGKITYPDGRVQEGNWEKAKFVGKSATPQSALIQPQPAVPPHDSAKKYKIGDCGPAGGIIFYKKWNKSDGWQYLEAAPSDLQNAKSGMSSISDIHGYKTETGCGKRNTEIIIATLNKKGESGKAAQLCKAYSLNGYNDWFLPSRDELNLLYVNLWKKNLGGFSYDWYLSSSRLDGSRGYYGACIQSFSDGSQSSSSFLDNMYCVRPIRAF